MIVSNGYPDSIDYDIENGRSAQRYQKGCGESGEKTYKHGKRWCEKIRMMWEDVKDVGLN